MCFEILSQLFHLGLYSWINEINPVAVFWCNKRLSGHNMAPPKKVLDNDSVWDNAKERNILNSSLCFQGIKQLKNNFAYSKVSDILGCG